MVYALVDGMNGKYEIKEGKILVVCMYCFPRVSIFDTHPELRAQFKDTDLSHGICSECLPGILAGIRDELAAEKKIVVIHAPLGSVSTNPT